VSAQRFSAGKRFHWQGAIYEIKRWWPEEGNVSIEELLTGAIQVVDLMELVKELFEGALRFVNEGAPTRAGMDGEPESEYVDLADCPEHLVLIARHRLEVIQPLMELEAEARTESAVEGRVREVRASNQDGASLLTAVSVRSVYRWLSDYEQSGYDLRALIPNTDKRGGKGKSRLDPEVNAITETVIEDKGNVRERVTVDDVWVEIAARIDDENRFRAEHERLKVPSRATISRRMNARDPRKRFAARYGKQVAKKEFAQYQSTEYPQRPLERVEIDHTRMDLVVIDDRDNLPLGRLTLTYCLDMATRYPLGYYMGFEPPSYLTVMECLHHAICPKPSTRETYDTENEWIAYGIPSTLVVDNGREFIGQDLQDACLLLGIVLQQTPVKTPHFKAGVERLFGSLNTMLFHTLPGTTFSSPEKRGDYASLQLACVYLSDVDRIMNIFIVDFYAQRFHRGIEGLPAQRWEAARRAGFAPRVPPSAAELSILLGRVAWRALHHYGVQFCSLRYNSPELALLRTRLKRDKAKIKYHPADLSRVHVYDPFEKRYLEVPALDQEYTQGLSLWKHRIIRRAARAEYGAMDLAALGRAKRRIQEIVTAGRSRKRQSTRSRIARWETGGQPTRRVEEDLEERETDHEARETKGEDCLTGTLLAKGMELDMEELEEEGWDVSYDLPRGTS
jgi:putative transposase